MKLLRRTASRCEGAGSAKNIMQCNFAFQLPRTSRRNGSHGGGLFVAAELDYRLLAISPLGMLT